MGLKLEEALLLLVIEGKELREGVELLLGLSRMQAVAPAALKRPALQGVQLELPCPAAKVLAGQRAQLVLPEPEEKLPGLQLLQLLLPGAAALVPGKQAKQEPLTLV